MYYENWAESGQDWLWGATRLRRFEFVSRQVLLTTWAIMPWLRGKKEQNAGK